MISSAYSYLSMLSGFFYDAHRAVADCEAAVELLSRPLPISGRRALAVLLEAARKVTYRVWVRIPTKPAGHSNLKPATYSETKPAGVPI